MEDGKEGDSQFGPGFIGCSGNCFLDACPEEQDLESSSRLWVNSGLGGQRRSRRVGREKHVHTEGQRHFVFPQKMYATGQEAEMRKAYAELGTGDSLTTVAAPEANGNGFTGCTALFRFLSFSLTLYQRTLYISSAKDTDQNLGPSFETENMSLSAGCERGVTPLQLAGLTPASTEAAEGPAGNGGHWRALRVQHLATEPHTDPNVRVVVILDSLMTGLKSASVRNYLQITFCLEGHQTKS